MKRRQYGGTLTLDRELALTLGKPNGEPDDVLEGFYWQHRDRLLADCEPGSRPWAYWRFEGPPELIDPYPALVPAEAAEHVAALRRSLDARRRAWLAEHDG